MVFTLANERLAQQTATHSLKKTNYQTIKTREQVYIYKNDTLTSFLKNKLGLNVFSIPLGFHISNSSKEAEKSCPFCVSDETDGSHSLAPFAPIIEFAAATRAVVLDRVREVQRNHPKMARERESQAVRHPSIDRQKSLSRNEKEKKYHTDIRTVQQAVGKQKLFSPYSHSL